MDFVDPCLPFRKASEETFAKIAPDEKPALIPEPGADPGARDQGKRVKKPLGGDGTRREYLFAGLTHGEWDTIRSLREFSSA